MLRPWLRWVLLSLPAPAMLAAIALFLKGDITLAWTLLAGGLAIGLVFIAPFLPVYTPSRARVFRCVRWTLLLAMLGLAFGPNGLKWSWLLFSCLWPMAWIEWTRISIRRKLPVAEWPKQLYL